jgi:hypothetical protein
VFERYFNIDFKSHWRGGRGPFNAKPKNPKIVFLRK